MWPTGTNYRDLAVRSHTTPFYTVSLYDDSFEFSGTNLGTSAYDKYFYNSQNNKVYVTTGTPVYSGVVYDGKIIKLGTGGTIGTWMSPPLTAFYKNASWYKIWYKDFTFYEEDDLLRFNAEWQDYESMQRQGLFVDQNTTDIVYWGSYNVANRIKFINTGSTITGIQIPEILVGTNWMQYGECHVIFQTDSFWGSSLVPSTDDKYEVVRFITDRGDDINMGIFMNVVGTEMILQYHFMEGGGGGGGFLELGTIGTGIPYFIDFDWNQNVALKICMAAWITYPSGGSYAGTFIEGTKNRISNVGAFQKMRLGYFKTTTSGSMGTYWLGPVSYWGTQEHANVNAEENRLMVTSNMDYYIRTGSNGTNWNAWEWITGTRVHNTDNRWCNEWNSLYLGTSTQKGNYAQVMAVMKTVMGTGTNLRPYFSTVGVRSRMDLGENYVINSAPVENQIESNFKMGQFITNSYNCDFTNSGNKFLNIDKFVGGK